MPVITCLLSTRGSEAYWAKRRAAAVRKQRAFAPLEEPLLVLLQNGSA